MHIYQIKIRQLFLALLTFCFIFIPNSAWAIQKDIIILYTNDVHCGIEDNLGYTTSSIQRRFTAKYTIYCFSRRR